MKKSKRPLFSRLFKEVTELTSDIPVSTIMATNLKTLQGEATVEDAINLMAKHSLSSIPIVNSKDEPVGIVTTGDLVKKVLYLKKDRKTKLKEIMSLSVETITPESSIGDASTIMKKKEIRRLPIVKDDKLVGVITSTDIMRETNRIYLENRKLMWNRGLLTLLYIIFVGIFILLLANLFIK